MLQTLQQCDLSIVTAKIVAATN